MRRQIGGGRFCPDSLGKQTPVTGDFSKHENGAKFAPCLPIRHADFRKQTKTTAEEDTMNTEMLEINAVTDVAKSDETVELFALSVEDLDLVGGGAVIGCLG